MKARNRLIFAVACLCSLGFITVVDDVFASLLTPLGLETLAYIRLPSMVLAVFAFLLLADRSSLRILHSSANWRLSIFWSLSWLLPAAYFVLGMKVWVPSLTTWIDVAAFMVIGLIAEELIFRGIIYQKVLDAFDNRKEVIAVVISAIMFGVSHLQYHDFRLTEHAMMQVAYTIVMGLVFGQVRRYSRSLSIVVFVHFLNNMYTLVRNF